MAAGAAGSGKSSAPQSNRRWPLAGQLASRKVRVCSLHGARLFSSVGGAVLWITSAGADPERVVGGGGGHRAHTLVGGIVILGLFVKPIFLEV